MGASLKIEGLEVNDLTRKNDMRRFNKGRPKGIPGAIGGGRIRYRPKRWLPEYNQLVMDYIVIPGITYEELGNKYGYHKQQIYNIINSPQAKDIQEGMAKGILKYNETNVTVKLGEISKKITERLHEFIHNDSYQRANPFAFLDKSLAIGKAIGSLTSEKQTGINVGGTTINNTQVNVAIGTEAAKELGESIRIVKELRDKSNEVFEESGEK